MEIRAAHPGEYSVVLGMLFADLDDLSRQSQLEDAAFRLGGDANARRNLIVAVEQTQIVGACWLCPMPGNTGLLHGPVSSAGRAEVVPLLLSTVAADRAYGIPFVQTLIRLGDTQRARALMEAGFQHAANLQYMVCRMDHFPDQSPDSVLKYRQVDDVGDELLCRLIERTYEETLDCPVLESLRSMEDVVSGYRHTGQHDPRLWQVAYLAGAPIGCVLLASHAPLDHGELIYLGIVPEQRGHGWGKILTEHALRLAGQCGHSMVVLGVDSANAPAIDIYLRCGFEAFEQRQVFVRAQ